MKDAGDDFLAAKPLKLSFLAIFMRSTIINATFNKFCQHFGGRDFRQQSLIYKPPLISPLRLTNDEP